MSMRTRQALTLGADVEYLLTRDGEPMWACDRYGGTKQKPIQFDGEPAGFMYQEDGVCLEVNMPPATTVEEFFQNAYKMYNLAGTLATAHGDKLHPRDGLQFEDSTEFNQLVVPKAFTVGCAPDYDAYLRVKRPPLDIALFRGARFAGGHIHIGYDTSLIPPDIMVRALDSYFTPLLDLQAGSSRTPFYGYGGLFRPKPYGVEYRSPNNGWSIPGKNARAYAIRALTQLAEDYNKDPEIVFEIGVNMTMDKAVGRAGHRPKYTNPRVVRSEGAAG